MTTTLPARRYMYLEGGSVVRLDAHGGHLFVTDQQDRTPECLGSSYDPNCNYCWLNVPHSVAMHTRSKEA